jgi:protein gp37
MAKTSIEWTSGPNGEEGYTFNPWLGCAKVHAGCTNCYAEVSQAVSMRKGGPVRWGEVWQGGQRVVVADSTWKHPFTWARKAAAAGQRRKVFCASLADVLEVPAMPPLSAKPGAFAEVERVRGRLDDARERLWPIIEDTAWMCGGCGRPCAPTSDTIHRKVRLQELDSVGAACEGQNGRCLSTPMGGLDFLLLTKRPENAGLVPAWARPLIWLGTSISDQKTWDTHGTELMKAKGFRYRFVSAEPMVGPVDFGFRGTAPQVWGYGYRPIGSLIDQVVLGFESGSKARPGNVEWIRQGLTQCKEAGVAAFVKQLGAAPQYDGNPTPGIPLELNDPKGGDMSEWPEDLQVRMFPGQRWESAQSTKRLVERFHRVPLDEQAPCLDCGREADGGLYLAGQLRPLCTTSHTLFTQSEHGKRLDESLKGYNALGNRRRIGMRATLAQILQEHAARELAAWLDLRRAERLNGARAVEPLP